MDAISLLKRDHQKVRSLFQEFAMADGDPNQRKIAANVLEELDVHTRLEEEIFYPAIGTATDDEGIRLVRAAVEEHSAAKILIDELKTLDPEGERYEAKFRQLVDGVEHHIHEEETAIFPYTKKALPQAEIDELGNRMNVGRDALSSSSPTFLGETLQQARTLIAKALDAFSGLPVDAEESYAGQQRTADLRPVPAPRPAKRARTTPRRSKVRRTRAVSAKTRAPRKRAVAGTAKAAKRKHPKQHAMPRGRHLKNANTAKRAVRRGVPMMNSSENREQGRAGYILLWLLGVPIPLLLLLYLLHG